MGNAAIHLVDRGSSVCDLVVLAVAWTLPEWIAAYAACEDDHAGFDEECS